jgi:hypothetical protein
MGLVFGIRWVSIGAARKWLGLVFGGDVTLETGYSLLSIHRIKIIGPGADVSIGVIRMVVGTRPVVFVDDVRIADCPESTMEKVLALMHGKRVKMIIRRVTLHGVSLLSVVVESSATSGQLICEGFSGGIVCERLVIGWECEDFRDTFKVEVVRGMVEVNGGSTHMRCELPTLGGIPWAGVFELGRLAWRSTRIWDWRACRRALFMGEG